MQPLQNALNYRFFCYKNTTTYYSRNILDRIFYIKKEERVYRKWNKKCITVVRVLVLVICFALIRPISYYHPRIVYEQVIKTAAISVRQTIVSTRDPRKEMRKKTLRIYCIFEVSKQKLKLKKDLP